MNNRRSGAEMKPRDAIGRGTAREYLYEIRRNMQIAKICGSQEERLAHIDIALGFISLLEKPEANEEVRGS